MRYLTTLWLVGCQACAGTLSPPQYVSYQAEIEYGSSVRLLVKCAGDGAIGSGVSVGPYRVLTARHVVDDCDGSADEKITGYLLDGTEVNLRLTKFAAGEDIDAALLGVVGAPLKVWAHVSPRTVYTGELVCSVGGAALWIRGMRKCGYVARDDGDGWLYVSLQAIPGNSGSPVYDASGYVVGLLVRGTFQGEPVMIAQLATSFRDLL